MFTGIITDIGSVASIKTTPGGTALSIACHYEMNSIAIGASIACNGICLTVTEKTDQHFQVHASSETARVSTLEHWKKGDSINLERALKMGDELGGHLVQGHVDAVAPILSIIPDGESHILRIGLPAALAPLVAQKGSITVDGISLTVNAASANDFSLMIIPHTWSQTTLKHRRVGDHVNLEADLFARYLQRHLSLKAA